MTLHRLPMSFLANSTDFGAGGLHVRGVALNPGTPTDIDWAAVFLSGFDYVTVAGPGTSEFRIYQNLAPDWDDKDDPDNRPADGMRTPAISFNFTTASNAGDSTTTGAYTITPIGLAAGGGGGPAPGSSFPDDPYATPFRGQSPDVSYGTTAVSDYDILVDAAGGGDYTTWTAAMAAATSGKRIAGRAGVYREQFTHKSGVTIQGYGTERPKLSAQGTALTFTQCGAGDSGVLGSVLGVASSPVWKATGITKASLPVTDLMAINPIENGTPLANCADRADMTKMWSQQNAERYHDPQAHGGGYTLSGSTILGLVDPVVITSAKYTNAELTSARVRVLGSPNESYLLNITAANVTTHSITISGGKAKDGTGIQAFAIQNVAKSLVAGTWFVKDNGTTIDLYVYPHNPADIDKVSIAARSQIAVLATGAVDVAFKGIHFEGAGGDTSGHGTAIADTAGSNTSNGVLIENCRFDNFVYENTNDLSHGVVSLLRTFNIKAQNNTFSSATIHGLWTTGSTTIQDGCVIRRNVFKRTGSGGAKAWKTSRVAMMHNYYEECCERQHANLFSTYLGGDSAIIWGLEAHLCPGFITAQDNTRQNVGFCFLPCYSRDPTPGSNMTIRKVKNQGGTGVMWAFNNSLPPVVDGTAGRGHLALDLSGGGVTATYLNNIAHGINPPKGSAGTVALAKSNLNTHDGFWSGPGGSGNLGPGDFDGGTGDFDTTNRHNTNLASVFTNYANGDYSPASAGSDMLTMTTQSIRSFVEDYLIPTFTGGAYDAPAADFELDCFLNAIDLDSPKMGADQSIHA